MDNRIFIKDWLELKPYKKQTITDSYYLKICNEVKRAIITNKQSFILEMYLDNRQVDLLCCFLTSYFEDVISGTNIWNSFIQLHKQLYQKQLPFYALDEYYEDEINTQDISFLIWYFLNTVQEEKFISPFNGFIVEAAEKTMDVFDKEWDHAPENEYLKSLYRIDKEEDDYYVVRNLIDRVLFETYLFYPDTFLKLQEQEFEIIEESEEKENLLMFLNENRDSHIHKVHTRLLSLKGKEWVAEIVNCDQSYRKQLTEMSQRIRGFFLYKGQDGKNIFIEHIASGKRFNLTKKSFDHYDSLKEEDTILFMGIVRWKNEWWFSGVYFQQDFNPDIILDEKNSLESRMEVDFLDHEIEKTDELLKKHQEAFNEYNNGSSIAFLPSESIESYYKGYINFFNNSLNLSKQEKEKIIQRTKSDGLFVADDEHNDLFEQVKSGLVWFNPKSGVEIALDLNSAFPTDSNPYFTEDNSDDDVMQLLMDESISTELAMYCIDNYKMKLPFFKDEVGQKYLDDIDFLLRFWKKDFYHTKPAITYTGRNDN